MIVHVVYNVEFFAAVEIPAASEEETATNKMVLAELTTDKETQESFIQAEAAEGNFTVKSVVVAPIEEEPTTLSEAACKCTHENHSHDHCTGNNCTLPTES
jgi:hypothetical protein